MKFSKYGLIYLVPLSLATHVIDLTISLVERKRHGHAIRTRVERSAGDESLAHRRVKMLEWNLPVGVLSTQMWSQPRYRVWRSWHRTMDDGAIGKCR